MSIRKENLAINEPCSESWQRMSGDVSRRFCGSCTKHVYNLSEMTEPEARKLLRENTGLCVRYRYGDDGLIRFADSNVTGPRSERKDKLVTVQVSRDEQLLRQRGGVARLSLVASTLLAAGLLAACDASASLQVLDEPPVHVTEHTDDSVAQADDGQANDQRNILMGRMPVREPVESPPVEYETMGEPVPVDLQHQFPEYGEEHSEQGEEMHEIMGDLEYIPEPKQ